MAREELGGRRGGHWRAFLPGGAPTFVPAFPAAAAVVVAAAAAAVVAAVTGRVCIDLRPPLRTSCSETASQHAEC